MITATSNENNTDLYELVKRFVHDIRSPLGSLIMWSQYSTNLQGEEKKAVDISIKRIKNLVDATNDNLCSTKSVLNIVNIDNVIQNILLEKRNEYLERDLEFIYNNFYSSKEVEISDYQDEFPRMLSNLINNAIEACINKCGIIKIELNRDNEKVILSVEDNGCGIPEEVLQKIRNNIPVTYNKQNGLGIGMQQIRHAIAKLKGELIIKSTIGKGSKFSIIFNLNN